MRNARLASLAACVLTPGLAHAPASPRRHLVGRRTRLADPTSGAMISSVVAERLAGVKSALFATTSDPTTVSFPPTASSMSPFVAVPTPWRSLGTPRDELRLECTLPTGQTFRWRRSTEDVNLYTGVIGQRVVQLQQGEDDVLWRVIARGSGVPAEEDASVLKQFLRLDIRLAPLVEQWSAADSYFAEAALEYPGARMLDQEPLECLFQFMCSSNNHISRIEGMVERLVQGYGTCLLGRPSVDAEPASGKDTVAKVEWGNERNSSKSSGDGADPHSPEPAEPSKPSSRVDDAALAAALEGAPYHAFPTAEQLLRADEEALRAAGFGYRARYIVGSCAALLEKPGGSDAWLASLRESDDDALVIAELCTLPGVGPKVAACVALFSLAKPRLVPVDVHVLALAARRYAPHLKGRAPTPALHAEVQAAFEARFGKLAGWAHNTLFVAEVGRRRRGVPPGRAKRRGAAVGGTTKAPRGPKTPLPGGNTGP